MESGKELNCWEMEYRIKNIVLVIPSRFFNAGVKYLAGFSKKELFTNSCLTEK